MKKCLVIGSSFAIRGPARRALALREWSIVTREVSEKEEAFRACTFAMPDFILFCEAVNYELLDELRKLRGGESIIVTCLIEAQLSSMTKVVHAGSGEYTLLPIKGATAQEKLRELELI